MKFYEEYALQNNCKYLRIDTNEKNKIARNLYKSLRYEEIGMIPCTFNGVRRREPSIDRKIFKK